jgi:hypothetical protein
MNFWCIIPQRGKKTFLKRKLGNLDMKNLISYENTQIIEQEGERRT